MRSAIDGDAYRSLFDQNPQPMWVFDTETLAFVAVNDAAIRQYGYSREEFLERTILDIRPADEAPRVRESLAKGLSQPAVWTHSRRDNSLILVEITAHDLIFGERPSRLVTALDVTERERITQLARHKTEILRTVLQVAPVGVLLLSANGEVIECNDEARRLLGEPGPDALTRIAHLGSEAVELELAANQWAEVRSQPVDMDGEPDGRIVVLSDANERRAARGKLARENETLTAAARSTDAELQEFCFSVSHDLRGPLRAVDGFTQSVLSDPDADLSEENKDALLRVRRAATRMGELIDGLLVLSRVSRAAMASAELDLSAMFQRVAHDLERTHPNRNLHFDIAPELTGHGDPALVGTMIDALLSNAVKFTQNQSEAHIDVLADGDGILIRDNGVGFDMTYGEKLFKPFEKLHPNAEFPGNGLGLALVARILKRHGGSIEGKGEPGQGASFRISLSPTENP